ncbi:hypothetical protein [Marinactinospora rubrisoli]|uniref:Uncharacterized protein n=1 Tax=Marinactinospora rubrisoli TaxID=2715399 RepID=A0ABW2KKX1_9ACTN
MRHRTPPVRDLPVTALALTAAGIGPQDLDRLPGTPVPYGLYYAVAVTIVVAFVPGRWTALLATGPGLVFLVEAVAGGSWAHPPARRRWRRWVPHCTSRERRRPPSRACRARRARWDATGRARSG